VARRFRVISTGWFELRRLPVSWRPRYLIAKLRGRRHWRVGDTLLLSHPGCILSYTRRPETILEALRREIERDDVTVLVTHWWEYFRDGKRNEPFIRVLHELADYLATRSDISVTTFAALAGEPRHVTPRLAAASAS
jgi:hypothetical protein